MFNTIYIKVELLSQFWDANPCFYEKETNYSTVFVYNILSLALWFFKVNRLVLFFSTFFTLHHSFIIQLGSFVIIYVIFLVLSTYCLVWVIYFWNHIPVLMNIQEKCFVSLTNEWEWEENLLSPWQRNTVPDTNESIHDSQDMSRHRTLYSQYPKIKI